MSTTDTTTTHRVRATEVRRGDAIVTAAGEAIVEGIHREGGRLTFTFSSHRGRMVKQPWQNLTVRREADRLEGSAEWTAEEAAGAAHIAACAARIAAAEAAR